MEREITTLRLPRELLEELQREAARLGMSFNALVIIYCRAGLAMKPGHAPARTP